MLGVSSKKKLAGPDVDHKIVIGVFGIASF